MTSPFTYSTTFVLDRAHFHECYSNTAVVEHSLVAYLKAIIFLLVGSLLLYFTEVSGYLSYFLIALGVIETLSIYYRQPWWVTRQMLSRHANAEVTLTLDETGVHSLSSHANTVILWQDLSEINNTKDGVLLMHSKGRNYISNTCLSAQARTFLSSKLE
jgi:hypothetical protein